MKFSVAFFCASTLAHITLNSPTPRGDDEIASMTGPCGEGLDTPSASRATANASGYKINLTVADKDAQVTVNVGVGANPKTFPFQVASLAASLKKVDIPLDFSKVAGLTNGDLVTIQVIETAADGTKYACADVVMAGLATAPSGTTTTGNSQSTNSKPSTSTAPVFSSGSNVIFSLGALLFPIFALA